MNQGAVRNMIQERLNIRIENIVTFRVPIATASASSPA